MLSGFYILHKKNPQGNEVAPPQASASFKTCLRWMHFLWLRESEALQPTTEFEVYQGVKAYQFLLEVICGLQSPVVGETEVFGQFKNFLQATSLEYPLQTLLSQAVTDTKKIRSLHLRDLGGQSYGSLIRKMIRQPAQVHLIGGGSFAEDLLPWVYKDENQVRLWVRDVEKAKDKFLRQYPQLDIQNLTGAQMDEGVVIIAAPLTSQQIAEWVTNKDLLVIDLRGESRTDECRGFKNYQNLTQFFSVIEDNQQKMLQIKAVALQTIDEISQQRLMVESFRPFGWDDICVW